MSITTEEAAQIARAYKLSLTDAETLIRLVGPAGTYEDAVHLAIDFAGSTEERTGQAYADARKKEDADKAAEYKAFDAYQAANPKAPKSKRKPVEPEYRDWMTSGDRQKAFEAAHEANVKAEAEDRWDGKDEGAKDYYNWKASDDYRNWKASLGD